MPLVLKPRHYPPADQRPAGRMVMAAQARGLDAQALSHAILTALWVELQRVVVLPRLRPGAQRDAAGLRHHLLEVVGAQHHPGAVAVGDGAELRRREIHPGR